MRKTKVTFFNLVFFLLIAFSVFSQNLVPNPDFESYTVCPSGPHQFNLAAPWFNPTANIPDTTGTPDYYNACSTSPYYSVPYQYSGNYQPARSGIGFAGMFNWTTIHNNYREYFSVQLTTPLSANTCYYFEMYINVCVRSAYTNDDIGIYFSDTLVTGVNNYLPLPFTPQIENPQGNFPDSINWMQVSGTYAAHGGENSIIIGNFKDNAHTDTLLYNPTSPWDATYLYIDDVLLTPCVSLQDILADNFFSVTPNPASDEIVVNFPLNSTGKISVSNAHGTIVLAEQFNSPGIYNVNNLNPGLYIVHLLSNGKHFYCKFIKY